MKNIIPLLLGFVILFSCEEEATPNNEPLSDPIIYYTDEQGALQYSYVPYAEYQELSIKNLRSWPLTVRIEMHGVNMKSDETFPLIVELQGNEEVQYSTFRVEDSKLEYYFYLDYYKYINGYLDPTHDDYTYELPYANGEKYRVSQGYDRPDLTHFDQFAKSLDFDMPEYTELYAARDGWVIEVIEEYTGFSFDESYKTRTNLVNILHPDGTIGNYAHSVQNGIEVEVGDYVQQGDFLGYSGVVGYTDDFPHLHFHVFCITDFDYNAKTFPTRFNTAEGSDILLVEEEYYTSVNNTTK